MELLLSNSGRDIPQSLSRVQRVKSRRGSPIKVFPWVRIMPYLGGFPSLGGCRLRQNQKKNGKQNQKTHVESPSCVLYVVHAMRAEVKKI